MIPSEPGDRPLHAALPDRVRPLAAARLAAGRGHGGLILVPAKRSRTRAAAGPLASGIEAVMRANPDGLADSERWLAPIA